MLVVQDNVAVTVKVIVLKNVLVLVLAIVLIIVEKLVHLVAKAQLDLNYIIKNRDGN